MQQKYCALPDLKKLGPHANCNKNIFNEYNRYYSRKRQNMRYTEYLLNKTSEKVYPLNKHILINEVKIGAPAVRSTSSIKANDYQTDWTQIYVHMQHP